MTFFIFNTLPDKEVPHAEEVSRRVGKAFADYPNWRLSEKDLRELRKQVTFAIYAKEEDLDKVTVIVDELFAVLQKTHKT